MVGINAYESLTPLQTAVNDARLIGRTLREQGFEVMVVEDATRRQFNATWQRFLDTVRPDVFAMVFFAGHGVQMDGVNFLIPRDAPNPAVAEKELLKKETINFAELMDELGGRAPAVSLYVLDACRSNPYAGAARRGLGTRGLSPTDPAKGAFVMYSAGAGEDAWDSLPDDPPGAGNSVYTRRLVPLLKTPGLSFQALALRVRSEVQQLLGQHGHAQTPAYYDNLSGTVCFTGGCGGQAKL